MGVVHPSQIKAVVRMFRLIIETVLYKAIFQLIYVFKAILYKLYNPIVTVFKGQFLQWAGVTKRLLLKLFSLSVLKILTSALNQTVIARHSFGTV